MSNPVANKDWFLMLKKSEVNISCSSDGMFLFLNNLVIISFDLDLHETGHLCSTNWTFVSLHPDNLWALNAEAHVPTGKHNCVLCSCEANDTFFLRLVYNVSCYVVNAVNVVHVKDRIVILKRIIMRITYKELLLEELKFQCAWAVLQKLAVSDLNWFLRSSSIALGE